MYTKEELQAQIHNIIEKHIVMTYRIALQNVRSVEAAEDISQEVFIRLLEADTAFNGEEHIKAWLITVTLNMCRDHFRKAKIRNSVSLDGVVINIKEKEQDEHIDLLNALYGLRKEYRNVLYLFYYEEYTIQEIAAMMNKTKSTINTWLRRARKELAEVINVKAGGIQDGQR